MTYQKYRCANLLCSKQLVPTINGYKRLTGGKRQMAGRTPAQGLAIKLGMTPLFIPTLLAINLKRVALSAILAAVVYA